MTSKPRDDSSDASFVHLAPGARIDPALVFSGPWKAIERLLLEVGDVRHFQQHGHEVALYVIDGQGTMTVSGHEFPLREGSAITMLNRSDVTVAPVGAPLDLLVTTVAVNVRDN